MSPLTSVRKCTSRITFLTGDFLVGEFADVARALDGFEDVSSGWY
jgi:hypothetical protein